MKKIIAIFLAGAIAVTLSFASAAAVPQRIKALRASFAAQLGFALDDGVLQASELDKLEVHPDSQIEITLAGNSPDAFPDLFLDQNGAAIATADVTVSKMRAAKVVVQHTAAVGADLIDSVTLDVRNAGSLAAKPVIRVRFISELASTQMQPFEMELAISIGDIVQEHSKIKLVGTFFNNESFLTAADTAANSSDGSVLVAVGAIPDISLDLGYGVILQTSMPDGGRYWAVASPGSDAADNDLMQKYSALNEIIVLRTVGFTAEQLQTVRIESSQLMYIYSGDGKYLGPTNSTLPYQEKYLIASRKIDF